MPITNFPELTELERILDAGAAHLEVQEICRIDAKNARLPLYSIALGNPAPELPALGFFGGLHGLERIGTAVVLAYLNNLVTRLRWDNALQRRLESVRLVFMPLINPGGMLHGTRSNPHGVDLMRNAPIEAHKRVPFMLGGQRLSRTLPWFRGVQNAPMEAENKAVCHVVENELLSHRFSLSVDCHSGFGLRDRIWFPYAHTTAPIEHLAEIHALKMIYDASYPHHNYVFEPQSRQYLTHGDLWDYLYRQAHQADASGTRIFLPLTLELGSWLWVKKNPSQLFTRHGMFNPLIAHRQQRVLRRHLPWFDFLVDAAVSRHRWLPDHAQRARLHQDALALWYGHKSP